jgi:hypothetical protein
VSVFPLPARATEEQPLIELAPSLKFTVPVGDVPVTVAVKVTLLPVEDGLSDVPSAVEVAAPFTTCDRALLVEPVLLASPP